MSNAANQYLLGPRIRQEPYNQTYTPKVFKALVEDLPVGNVGRMAQELHEHLRALSSIDMSVADRLENLEMLLDSTIYILKALGPTTAQELSPQGKQKQLIEELHETLCVFSVRAYKVVLDQYHSESLAGHLLHKQYRALALHRVLFFLSQSLLCAYQAYKSHPRYIWREIHGIYQYAQDQHLVERQVEDEGSTQKVESTITDLYKQILLLALSGPYRLMPGEVSHVYLALKNWSPECRLSEWNESSSHEGDFLVDVGVDEPPRLRGAVRDREIKKGWVLDASALAVHLAEELSSKEVGLGLARPKDSLDGISPELLVRLMLTWGVGFERSSKRDVKSEEVVLICGLNDLYASLGGDEIIGINKSDFSDQETEAEFKNRHKGVPRTTLEADEFYVDGGEDLPQLSHLETDIPHYRHIDVDEVEEIEITSDIGSGSVVAPLAPMIKSFTVYDESTQGYHLGWAGEGESPVKVGDLVGIQRQDLSAEEGVMRLGIVRWVRHIESGLVDFGVEFFEGDVTPVIFCYQRIGRVVVDNCPALLLMPQDGDASLLTPPFYIERSDSAWLVEGGQGRAISLSHVIEASASFIQFHFKGKDIASESDGQRQAEEDQFSQLWDNLK